MWTLELLEQLSESKLPEDLRPAGRGGLEEEASLQWFINIKNVYASKRCISFLLNINIHWIKFYFFICLFYEIITGQKLPAKELTQLFLKRKISTLKGHKY